MNGLLVYFLLLSPFPFLVFGCNRLLLHPETSFFVSLIFAPLVFIWSVWFGFILSTSIITLFILAILWLSLGLWIWQFKKINANDCKPSLFTFSFFLLGYLLYLGYAYLRPFSEHDTFEYIALGNFISNGFNPFNYRFNPLNGYYYVGYHPPVYALFFSVAEVVGDVAFISVKSLSGYFYLSSSLLAAGFLYRLWNVSLYSLLILIICCFGWFFSVLQFHLETMRMAALIGVLIITSVSLTRADSWPGWIMLGAVCGLASGIHFINLVFCCLLALAVFIQFGRKLSVKSMISFVSAFFLLGGFYYVIEFFEQSAYFKIQ